MLIFLEYLIQATKTLQDNIFQFVDSYTTDLKTKVCGKCCKIIVGLQEVLPAFLPLFLYHSVFFYLTHTNRTIFWNKNIRDLLHVILTNEVQITFRNSKSTAMTSLMMTFSFYLEMLAIVINVISFSPQNSNFELYGLLENFPEIVFFAVWTLQCSYFGSLKPEVPMASLFCRWPMTWESAPPCTQSSMPWWWKASVMASSILWWISTINVLCCARRQFVRTWIMCEHLILFSFLLYRTISSCSLKN